MYSLPFFPPLLLLLFLLPLLRATTIDVATPEQFHNLTTNQHVFAYFYHPDCLFCKASSPVFKNLSHSPPQPFVLAQISAGLPELRPLFIKYSPTYPTFKIFINGTEQAEFTGTRTEPAMRAFLEDYLHQLAGKRESTRVIAVRNLTHWQQLHEKIQPLAKFVLLYPTFDAAVQAYPGIQLSEPDWMDAVTHYPDHFGAVFLSMPFDLFRSQLKSSAEERLDAVMSQYYIQPLVASAAADCDLRVNASFFVPGIRENPLSSFLYTSTMGQYMVLTQPIAKYYLESPHILALVFGDSETPSYQAVHYLESISGLSQVVPLYANIHNWTYLAEHVGLPVENLQGWETQYALYRFANRGKESYVYRQEKDDTLPIWTQNQVRLFTAMGTKAGHVQVLNSSSWTNLFTYDIRSVIVGVSQRAQCRGLQNVLQSAASDLAMHAVSVYIAVYCEKEAPPDWPKVSFDERERVYWIAADQPALEYDQALSRKGVVQFAAMMADVSGDAGGFDMDNVTNLYMLVVGLVLVVVAVVLWRRNGRRGLSKQNRE